METNGGRLPGRQRDDADLLYLLFFIFFESFVFSIDKPCLADPKVPPHRIGFFCYQVIEKLRMHSAR